MPNSHDAHLEHATQIPHKDLVEAYAGMATGITRPASIRWRLDDANKGRPVKPLGSFPEVAEACIDSGGSFHHVTRPLTVMLAHLRRRCTGKVSGDIRQALMNAKRESDEAEACALRLALSVNSPEASDLLAFDKEATDAMLALAKAREIVEDRLIELRGT